MKLQTFLQSGKKHENSNLVLPFTSFLYLQKLPVRIVTAMTLHFSRCALHLPAPPNQIIAQSAWNESAEQEKQFDICFLGVGVGGDDLRPCFYFGIELSVVWLCLHSYWNLEA